MGLSQPWLRPMAVLTALIKAEWEEGMPPALISSAQSHFFVRK